jgi:hypothetical protein
MPDYSSLSTQITAVKSEIADSLAASVYTAQDLVYIASALDKLGSMLGVNDIVAATAAQVSAINAGASLNIITETTTARTLNASVDALNLVYCTNSSTTTLTVPTNSAQAFAVGASIEIIQAGTGQVVISPASGVTVNSCESLYKTRSQWSACVLMKVATDTWVLSGDLTA